MKKKSDLKYVLVFIIIVLIILGVIYFSRKDIAGKSYLYLSDEGYVLIYHGCKYIQVEKGEYSIFSDQTPFILSDELISRGGVGIISYFLPKSFYGRVSLPSKEDYPEFMELAYAWDCDSVYMKRQDQVDKD